jgi:hypothetical protein
MKRIFTKARLILLGKVVVSVVGAVITFNLLLAFYMGVGGIFGLVILLWHAHTLRDLVNWRCAVFLLVSMLIAVAVYFAIIPFVELGSSQDALEVFGPGVLVGTVLLPIAHSLLLGTTWKRTWIAIPCIYIIWALFFSISQGFVGKWAEPMGYWVTLNLSIVTHVTIWQATYLVSMFGFRKKGPLEEAQAEVVE